MGKYLRCCHGIDARYFTDTDNAMHDIKWIRDNPDAFDDGMRKRGEDISAAKLLALDEEKRQEITKLQKLQQERNAVTKELGLMPKLGTAFEKARANATALKKEITALEAEISNNVLETYLVSLPNIPAEDVEIRCWGTTPAFDFTPKAHEVIGEALGMMDFAQTAKISGARFVTLKRDLARMERALAQLMLDMAVEEHGYTELSPPYLVRDAAMFGVGQLPKFAEESFETTNGYRLIPTAEVPLVNQVADCIVDAEDLPLRFVACTPCFRSEAGAAGKDTRGMIRQHQFNKVELVSITTPEQSVAEHERITAAAEEVLKRLELPYRVVMLCAGDMGFAARKTYDLEVWLPAQNAYREISSCSNCGAFQARRMKARFRKAGEKHTEFVHTLNGSALAIGRTIIAILENYQQADGTVRIPEALQPYMGGKTLINILT